LKKSIQLSFVIAFAASALVSLFIWLSGDYVNIVSPSYSLTALVFLMTFIPVFIVLEFLIFRKIRKIYLQFSDGKKPATADEIGELEMSATRWIAERGEEIEQLKKLETYRKEFLGNVSHELKTPIFNIQGYISTLLDGGIDDPKINRSFLGKAEKSVERMITIVDDLQSISQLERGVLELNEESFDMVALVKDVQESLELRAKERNISFELFNDIAHPIFVTADKFRIRQVLVNLLVNSVRYGKEGGLTQVRVNDIGDKVLVEVTDNGIGIASEHLPRIFERFYRADKSRSRELGGTGLGLAIIKHIIEAHNQKISVLSTEGAGSVFSFTLNKTVNI
jgi:two-component system phosphate regulon sensor histidine kinase PhoR